MTAAKGAAATDRRKERHAQRELNVAERIAKAVAEAPPAPPLTDELCRQVAALLRSGRGQ